MTSENESKFNNLFFRPYKEYIYHNFHVTIEMKSNKNLQQLIDVISALSPSEIDVAKKHLSAYNSNHTIRTNKMFQLFHLIVFKKQRDYEKLKKKISSESDYRSFNRLIDRTLSRVEESLIIDVNLNRKGGYSTVFLKKYNSRKLLMQAQILISRGLYNRADKIYNKVILDGIKYELYDELIEVYLLKMNLASSGVKKINTNSIKKSINEIESERKGLREVRFLIQDYSAKISGKSNPTFMKKTLANHLEAMELICANLKSANTLSIYYLTKIEYNKLIRDFHNTIKIGIKLLNLINNNLSVYSTSRVIYLKNEIALAHLSLHEFKKSLEYSKSAKELFSSKNNSNYLINIETTIKSNFFLSNYNSIIEELKESFFLKIVKNNEYWSAKLNYYHSIVQFVSFELKDAFRTLNEISKLEKDKEGWNVWFRIMRILCSIELMRMSLIDYDIESFRKFIQRTDKSGNIRERDKLILKVLLDLDRNNYDFKLTYENRKEEFSKLESTNSPYSWDINSPEMIIFTEWFKAKINSKKYSHSHFFDNGETSQNNEIV